MYMKGTIDINIHAEECIPGFLKRVACRPAFLTRSVQEESI